MLFLTRYDASAKGDISGFKGCLPQVGKCYENNITSSKEALSLKNGKALPIELERGFFFFSHFGQRPY